jgi:predicted transcriptional regulator
LFPPGTGLRETIEVLSDTELVRDLREGLADARAGRVFSAREVAGWAMRQLGWIG